MITGSALGILLVYLLDQGSSMAAGLGALLGATPSSDGDLASGSGSRGPRLTPVGPTDEAPASTGSRNPFGMAPQGGGVSPLGGRSNVLPVEEAPNFSEGFRSPTSLDSGAGGLGGRGLTGGSAAGEALASSGRRGLQVSEAGGGSLEPDAEEGSDTAGPDQSDIGASELPKPVPDDNATPSVGGEGAGGGIGDGSTGGVGSDGGGGGEEPPPPPPKLLLVRVTTEGGAQADATIEAASADNAFFQAAIVDSSIDLRQSDLDAVVVESERTLVSGASSKLSSAELALIAEHVGVLATTLLNGEQVESTVISVADFLDLRLEAGRESATANVVSSTLGLAGSELISAAANESLDVTALSGLEFVALGNPDEANLAFQLLTAAVSQSSIDLGGGNNTITITSGFVPAPGAALNPAKASSAPPGVQFELADLNVVGSDGQPAPITFSVDAIAVGLLESSLKTGNGHDVLTVATAAGVALDEVPVVSVEDTTSGLRVQTIGLLRSEVLLGDGDDQATIIGDVRDSVIDVGAGNNHVQLRGAVQGESVVRSAEGITTVDLADRANVLGLESTGQLNVNGGQQADQLILLSMPEQAEIQGAGGQDRLEFAIGDSTPVALVVTAPNSFEAGSVRATGVESVALSAADDRATIRVRGQLSGSLDGGGGQDTIDYGQWQEGVVVDLDAGLATGINGGKPGGLQNFEAVVGSQAGDVLAFSTAASEVDAGDGDDLLYLRWSPQVNPGPDITGTQIFTGAGRDLLVLTGLPTTPPAVAQTPAASESVAPVPVSAISSTASVLPVLRDIRVTGSGSGALGLSDRIAWEQPDPTTGQAVIQELTPSGLEGLGNARMIPIAPLGQLLSGAISQSQLAIAQGVNAGDQSSLELLSNVNNATVNTTIAYMPAVRPFGGMTGFSMTNFSV